jgi:MOSC domain-containing protein YiiM
MTENINYDNAANVIAVCISENKGTPKHEISKAELRVDHGIVGDAHAGNWHRQVSLLADESVDKMRSAYPDIPIGAFAENILTRGIKLTELPIGTRLRIGSALLEVTQIGKECHSDCAIRRIVGDCVMPREGIFAKVIEEGTIEAGDIITVEKGQE